jgi:hypothetical protein
LDADFFKTTLEGAAAAGDAAAAIFPVGLRPIKRSNIDGSGS